MTGSGGGDTNDKKKVVNAPLLRLGFANCRRHRRQGCHHVANVSETSHGLAVFAWHESVSPCAGVVDPVGCKPSRAYGDAPTHTHKAVSPASNSPAKQNPATKDYCDGQLSIAMLMTPP